jgi:hypothetical protein
MTFIRAFLSLLVTLIRALVYDAPSAFVALWRHLFRLLVAWKARRSLTKWQRRSAKSDCVPIREPAFHRPDPLIYSQQFLMQQRLAVTWNNPDIVLRRGGSDVSSEELQPDTEYEIVARIWNGSTDASVIGLPVTFSYLSFGIGTQSHDIGQVTVDLGVKGGPQHPAFASMKWTTPSEGHYCIQVLLEWFDDLNPNNNLGQENTTVGKAQSPVSFTFKLRNASNASDEFRFEVDTYQIPQPLPCSPEQTETGVTNEIEIKEARLRRHYREIYPLPANWSVEIEPEELSLDAEEEVDIRIVVTPPDNFRGRQPINVNAFNRLGLAGGVTLFVVGE